MANGNNGGEKGGKRGGVREFLSTLFFPLTSTLDFLQSYFKGILIFLLLLFLISTIPQGGIGEPNLITVTLRGAIIDSAKVLKEIEEAEKPRYKGVLFVIDSPGGAVAPSIEISRAIKRLRRKKPVVVYAAGTLASGSYYSAIWSNEIVANPGAIVGSIGVIFESPIIEDLLKKIGVEPQVVKAGKYKEVGTPFRRWKPYEVAEIKKVIEDTYEMFVREVCQARKLDCRDRERFAEAHIFTARQAKEVGLIDRVGTIDLAKKEVIRLSKVKRPVWKKPTKFEELIKELSNQTASLLASLLLGGKLW
ncbi:MAG: signal peptide peptidase SppA [Epsilonproteobacteria bacterium]|nr:signal peptide peptidase SppA [Campylobacterota bacterium]NPA56700.1 signal peptide peptidase SppA [Campylobacterota bacterium]